MMDFIEGVNLSDILRDPVDERTGIGGTRIMKEDVDEKDIECVYRQVANFLLQLFKLDFDRIGSLPTPKTKFPVPIRPLTMKAHNIIQTGGINTFGKLDLFLSSLTMLAVLI